jgi:DNA-binding LacI/PurR family transcriptional regulator
VRPVSRVTSQDVARRAGVSQSTVSLVFSGKAQGRISAATVANVERAAAELGYRPNVAARTLRTGRSAAVGLVVPDVTNPFFGRLLRGAQSEARRHGLTVVLVDAANDPELGRSVLDALRTAAVDGYLTFEGDRDTVGRLEAPTVAIEAWDADVPAVRFDVEAGTTATVEHLLGLGHRRIGHLASAHVTDTFLARERRADAVLDAAAIPAAARPRVRSAFDLDAAREAAHRLLEAAPTAVHCDDDVLASGLVLAARDRGMDVPADVSVAGFDDLDLARVLGLTTVRVDGAALGAAAVAALVALLGGEAPPRETVVPVELVVRGSTAPPRVR